MEHNISQGKEIRTLVQPHIHNEFPSQSIDRKPKQEMTKPDAGLLESMVEHHVKPFHQNSKKDVMIIYDLSQEVYYRHNGKNPELAKLAASLFLFFSDYGFYLNIEALRLIPVVQDLIEKAKQSQPDNLSPGQQIKGLRHKIQREHYSAIDKLKYFRILTEDYRMPAGACKSYKRFFDKLKKFENDLVLYIHFENNRFFPLAIEVENYLNTKKLY